jgi:hypothetical protein
VPVPHRLYRGGAAEVDVDTWDARRVQADRVAAASRLAGQPEVAVPEGGLSRRTVLLTAGAVGLLAACRLTAGSTDARPTPIVDPDRGRLAGALSAEAALLASYDATVGAHPALTPALAAIHADHTAHQSALAAELSRREVAQRSAGRPKSPQPAVGSPPPGSMPAPPPVPADVPAAVRALVAAETTAAGARGTEAVAAAADLAALLGSVAASEAAHAAVLALLPLPGAGM